MLLIYSLLAGMAITLGAAANLAVGAGPIGAVCFSIGLLMICTNKWYLFTGQAGKLAERQVKPLFLVGVFVGNFCGAFLSGLAISVTTLGQKVVEPATAIIQNANSNILSAFILSIFCGVLVNFAVEQFNQRNNPLYILFSVAIFIVCGYPHTIALMSYFALSTLGIEAVDCILIAAVGNLIGCNIIPLSRRILKKSL